MAVANRISVVSVSCVGELPIATGGGVFTPNGVSYKPLPAQHFAVDAEVTNASLEVTLNETDLPA